MIRLSTLLCWIFVSLGIDALAQTCIPCEKLKDIRLPDVTITNVESLPGDTIKAGVEWIPDVVINVPFCIVRGRISKEINFELMVPKQWNGRFLMSGGGGFVGTIQNDLVGYVNQGYATVGTDTGHQGDGLTAEWAFNNMERQLNFGKLAVHRTAVVSKAILRSLYCKDPEYSYFLGCSRGGGQAMMEAQQYPDDFNGLVAGAPAYAWPAIGAKFVEGCKKIYPDPKDLSKRTLTNESLKLLQEYVLQQCDNLDGIKDRIINDPRNCKIDVSKLPVCAGNKPGANCFTKEQVEAIKSIYSSVAVGGKEIYPGFPPGLEAESGSWDTWIAGTDPMLQNAPGFHYMFGTNLFKYMVYNDPSWDYSTYNMSNFFSETRYASSFLDATDPDYSALKNLKGKMIMYHGWNDAALSAYATIEHYEAAMKKDATLSSYVRLFMLPGVLHCGGGTGPDQVDWVKLIRDWVEQGKAPERVVMSKVENGKVVMTRPVFPYPKVSVYSGKGDVSREENFKEK